MSERPDDPAARTVARRAERRAAAGGARAVGHAERTGRPSSGGQRRRGPRLEAAILAAALDELAERGYAGLTMEGVAARAGTSKAVLYRRWRNRADLVRAAVRRREGLISDDLPDTGSLREDMIQLLALLSNRFLRIGTDTARGLMAEIDTLDPAVFEVVPEAVTAILRRGADRGEVDLARVTPRIVALPGDLLRHEIFISRRPLSEEGRIEIVDRIFLPLVSAR
ncbi:MAG TPA: TetR/AcrR family transcriptional regulator [Candidatus Dormibacteraeota bacterium]|jgi:AcrR family transcriptional regulator|nr:TetR/AcrR family transcriptional regulator [Candidatus Dormibacteraeota bacterium]